MRALPKVGPVVVAAALALSACGGEDPADIPGGGSPLEEEDVGAESNGGEAFDQLTGTDAGVTFDYHSGTVRVDLAGADEQLRDQVIGSKVTVACGVNDTTRRWPPEAETTLRFRLTREGADPGEVPTTVDRCTLSPVPGNPLASAEMNKGS